MDLGRRHALKRDFRFVLVVLILLSFPTQGQCSSFLIQQALAKEAAHAQSRVFHTASPVLKVASTSSSVHDQSVELCVQLCQLGWEHTNPHCSCSSHHLGAWSKRSADSFPYLLLHRLTSNEDEETNPGVFGRLKLT